MSTEPRRLSARVLRGPDAAAAEEGARAVRPTALPSTRAGAVDFDVQADGGAPLPSDLRNRFEHRLGHDFGNIRVHATRSAADAAEELGAKAFTIRPHIFFGAGRFAPKTSEGERLLGHELTHVVQQSRAGGPPVLQCDDLDDVKKVRSFRVEADAAHLTAAEAQLQKRLAKRIKDIEALLAQSSKASRKAELQKDLDKTIDEIVKTPDAKGVNPGLRKDVIESYKLTDRKKSRLQQSETEWHKLDPVFVDKNVVATLAGIGLKPADLKALIAQESGDLTKNPQEKDIAGIAQISSDQEKLAGGKAGDRKEPTKAIPLAAKVLVNFAADLKRRLKAVPAGIEWKKFLFAAYNMGAPAFATAQAEAIKAGLGGTTWNSIANGDTASPLFKACQKHYEKDPTPAAKYAEVVKHVKDIFERLEPP